MEKKTLSVLVICLIIYLVYNLFVFTLYGLDKHYAKANKWRIPEKVLLGTATIMGGLGAFLGMRVFHHKTKHIRFKIIVPLVFLVQLVLIGYIFYRLMTK